jgi:hypothetical protein
MIVGEVDAGVHFTYGLLDELDGRRLSQPGTDMTNCSMPRRPACRAGAG